MFGWFVCSYGADIRPIDPKGLCSHKALLDYCLPQWPNITQNDAKRSPARKANDAAMSLRTYDALRPHSLIPAHAWNFDTDE